MIVTGRNPEKTKRVADEVGSPALIADFADFEQVRRLADEIAAVAPKIDVLVNNAGGLFKVRNKTKDDHEPNFQINHLSPFLLTHLLEAEPASPPTRRACSTPRAWPTTTATCASTTSTATGARTSPTAPAS